MSSLPFDPDDIARETKFLTANPQFLQRPASIVEFLGKNYLEIADRVRPGVREALVEIFGLEVNPKRIGTVPQAMMTGAIGIGKTTFASIALPYMCHWMLCLRDPQGFMGLMPGSRIAFMQMSTSETQAREVIFGDILARIKHSPWFINNAPYDPKFTKSIRFPQDIWILPGDSTETTFEGYNILGGIIDEMDSHKVTQDKDYAETGYDTIHSRITSRFQDRGLLILIGQMKKAVGFAAKKYKEFKADPEAHVTRMTIWESFGWHNYLHADGTRDSFWYDARRKQIIPTGAATLVRNENLIEVPTLFKKNFKNNPEKALRDLAGIPPNVNDPFISLTHKIDAAVERWIEKHGEESPVDDNPTRPVFADWFVGGGDPRKRAIHLDFAVSGNGDALGFAMGHVSELVEREGELKPFIHFDCLLRIKAMPGTEIMFSDVRRYIYALKEERHFKIVHVTMDGFQSTDTRQQLQKRRFIVDNISCDKSTLPYEDLREAIYEDRVAFPPYMTYVNKGDTERVQIAVVELMGLQETLKKIDHPSDGSKDVADAMAGVCYTLMGDRTYRRGVVSMEAARARRNLAQLAADGTTGAPAIPSVPAASDLSYGGMKAPVPPAVGGSSGLSIPSRLRPRTGGG